jgi:hypothetical protein
MPTCNYTTFEAKGVPAASSSSRYSFAVSQLVDAFLRFVTLDMAITYLNATVPTLDAVSLPFILLVGGLMSLYVRWTMDIPYWILSAITVTTGMNTTADWPPLFGL